MSKFQKIAFFGFLFVIALMVYMEATKPVPVNWFPSYASKDKIPLGTYVLYDQLDAKFGDRFEDVNIPPFEKLKDSSLNATYLFINDAVSFDRAELDKLLQWVERGNTAFVSANYISYTLLDTLNLEIENAFLLDQVSTKPLVNLVHPKLEADEPYLIDRNFEVNYFSSIDTLNHTVLGFSQVYDDTLAIESPLTNYIKAPWGEGNLLLHTQPEVFSNFFMLYENNYEHTESVLSYINEPDTLLWDAYYKSGKPLNISPLQILFGNKYLKWAYYFALIGIALYVLFEGKRKQRSIPIVTPLANKTYEYTRTIAGMYFHRKEHAIIARKQIAMFMEYVRTKLRVPTERINKEFYRTVAARSGNTIEDTEKLFTYIEEINNRAIISPEDLKKVSQEIANFKKNKDGKS